MISDVPRELQPPAGLEDRTAAALSQQGLIRPPGAGARGSWTRLAAALVLFAVGAATGVWWADRSVIVTPGQSRYLLLLQGGNTLSPEDESRAVADYRAWARRLRDEGHVVAGERLAREVVVVPDAPLPAADDVQGYFVVAAADLAEAVAIARTSPHVERGGRVIVRPIDTPTP